MHTTIRCRVAGFFCAAAAMLGVATATRAAQTPSALDRIAVYNGTWQLDTITKAGGPSTRSIVRTQCHRSDTFYVCSQQSKGEATTLIVYAANGADRASVYFIRSGTTHQAAGVELSLRGNVWTYSGRLKDTAGRRVAYRNVNTFDGPNAIVFREEYSPDDHHWILMSRGREKRLLRA